MDEEDTLPEETAQDVILSSLEVMLQNTQLIDTETGSSNKVVGEEGKKEVQASSLRIALLVIGTYSSNLVSYKDCLLVSEHFFS